MTTLLSFEGKNKEVMGLVRESKTFIEAFRHLGADPNVFAMIHFEASWWQAVDSANPQRLNK